LSLRWGNPAPSSNNVAGSLGSVKGEVDKVLMRGQRSLVDIHELVIEMKLLERRLTLYEEKYGVLSADFYAALTTGQLAHYDTFDESRADFSRWKGIYETWLRRKEAYARQLQERGLAQTLRVQPAY
jgi:hypothetical protein